MAQGHLFDSGLINTLLDELESLTQTPEAVASQPPLQFTISNIDVRPNETAGPVPSRLLLEIVGEESVVRRAVSVVEEKVKENERADCVLEVVELKVVIVTLCPFRKEYVIIFSSFLSSY